METILKPCRVPWDVSPSMSGVTLIHSESDTEPECSVIFGGMSMNQVGKVDSRRIEVIFKHGYYTRTGYHNDDDVAVEILNYKVDFYEEKMNDYLSWRTKKWKESGLCPDPSFYVAKQSGWLSTLPSIFQEGFFHYIIDGRDGYVEIIAKGYKWREWLWNSHHRDEAPSKGPVVRSGKGIT